MTTAAEYRQYAEECLEAMRAAVIPEVRTALSTSAQRWIALAEQLEETADLPTSAYDGRAVAHSAPAPAGS